jgi:hypothetical protein
MTELYETLLKEERLPVNYEEPIRVPGLHKTSQYDEYTFALTRP